MSKGYMTGIGGGKFDPAGTMKRAMIVTVLCRMEGETVVSYIKRFKDVPDGKYYTYNFDPSDIDSVECYFHTVNYLTNDAVFGSVIHKADDDAYISETFDRFVESVNNREFGLDENPFFADPTHGDYTIKDAEGFFDSRYICDFSETGRY